MWPTEKVAVVLEALRSDEHGESSKPQKRESKKKQEQRGVPGGPEPVRMIATSLLEHAPHALDV